MLINIINFISLSLSLSFRVMLWGLQSRNTYKYHLILVGLVVLRGMAIRFIHITLYQVNIHSWDCLFSYRDLYLLAVGLWGYTQIVILFLLLSPQLQHHALGALEVKSLTLRGPLSRIQLTLSDKSCLGGWRQRRVAPVSPQGWVAPSTTLPVSPPPLARGTEEGTSARVPRPKGKRRPSARHPAAHGK